MVKAPCVENGTCSTCKSNKWSLYGLSLAIVSLCSGLVYGWPTLRLNLVDAGQSTLSEAMLSLVFTTGAWSTQAGRFFFGLARDRYGTRRTALVSLLSVIGGSLGVAFADASNVAALAAFMFFIGLGSGAQLCVQPVAGLFGNRRGTVLSSLSGAFQVSGVVFAVLTGITDNRAHSFGGFAVVVGILTVLAAIMLPQGPSFSTPSPSSAPAVSFPDDNGEDTAKDEGENDTSQRIDPELGCASGEEESPTIPPCSSAEVDEQSTSNGVYLNFNTRMKNVLHILWRVDYVTVVAWFAVMNVPLQYYVGSIGAQLQERGDDGMYTMLFSVLYASAAVCSPLGGYLADRLGLGIAQALAVTVSSVAFFVLASPAISLNGQAGGAAAYGVGRTLTFGLYFTNIGKRFGFANYGLLAGLGLLITATVSILQMPLVMLAAAGRSRQVNIACGLVCLGTLPYCIWLGFREKKVSMEENACTKKNVGTS